MKNTIKLSAIIALALVIALALSSCDFAAKNLAKQTVDAAKQMAELHEKAAGIEDKAAALSPKDRRAFQAELERLGVAGAPEWLYDDEAALLSGAPEETEDERGGIGGLLGGLFGGGSSGGGTGTFTLTGIPSQYNGKYALFMGGEALTGGDDSYALVGAQTITISVSGKDADLTLTPIRSGRAVLNVWMATDTSADPYRGNDTFAMMVLITDQAKTTADNITVGGLAVVMFEAVSFRNGSATKAWGDGEVRER
ncbi:MAG: hypothetical protein LBQ89_00710 [Treponema sp.]|nr:hypothetical protein [Treponema sp.]